MPIRDTIVDSAIWESDFGQWKPSGEEMASFFSTAGLTEPSDSDLAKFQNQTSNIVVNGQSIAWCGIFACYVLKRWGGLDVKWVPGVGMKGSSVTKVWDYRYIRPGDVAVIRNKVNAAGQYLHHHFIVTDIDYDANLMDSVDGNSTNNQIVWHIGRQLTQSSQESNFLKRPYAYYRVMA